MIDDDELCGSNDIQPGQADDDGDGVGSAISH
jgi:hypothetical protein